MKDVKVVLLEALKELFRIALLAVVPVVLEGLQSGSLNYKIVLVSAVVAVLKAVDKLLHEWGKVTDDGLLIKGLTRF